MFAAAATVAQMIFDGSIRVAQWLATKVFILSIVTIVLPWVLRYVLIWAFEWISIYGREVMTLIMTQISSLTGAANIDIDINLSGVGGYLAAQTGLIEYCSIIITGWGLYWVVAILAKTPRML
jgi:hypothetical protein